MSDTHGGLSNDLADWFPVVSATGIPVPETRIISIPESLTHLMLDERPLDNDSQRAIAEVAEAALELGLPVFLRTGEMAAKHSWDFTCHLRELGRITPSIYQLVETQAMAFGVPTPRHLVVREMMATEPLFYAFSGMPITRERRYFVEDGVVTDHQNYWPIGALEGQHVRSLEGPIDDDTWRSMLRSDAAQTDSEVVFLTALTERAAAGLAGAWSMDWLFVPSRGWVFTDAAHAEESYRMPADERAALVL